MYRRHRVLLLVVGVSLCVGLAGAWAAAPQRGGTLRIGYWQDMTGMDPHLSGGIPAVYVMQSIFQTLVTLNEELDLVPELAHAWDVQDGGTTYVFHLQKGVQFHDGTPLRCPGRKVELRPALAP